MATLDAVAKAARLPARDDLARLGPALAALSAHYNDRPGEPASPSALLAARLAFSFARDVPKSGAAIAEVIARGALPEARELSVLDLGAGLGATSWGVARALAAAGDARTLRAELIDEDRAALDLARAIAEARRGPLRVETRVADTWEWVFGGDRKHDLVLLGQTLSEMDRALDPEARADRHAELVRRILQRRLHPDGLVLIVEPALRARSRHLHAVRDRLVSAGARVFAPCLHDRPCPARMRENDWCHEDAPIDLPAALVPLARAASLRFERLSFSYLVLAKDGRALRDRMPAGSARVVSPPLVTKGKRELLLCLPDRAGLVRATRLDREREAPRAFDEAERGDVLAIEPPLAGEKARVTSAHRASRSGPDGATLAPCGPSRGAASTRSSISI